MNRNQPPVEQTTPKVARRTLLKRTALLAGGIAASGSGLQAATTKPKPKPKSKPAPKKTTKRPPSNNSDLDILNFALGLEYLENNFYARAAQAHAQHAYLHAPLGAIVTTIRDDEAAHVQALSAAITKAGGTPASPGDYSFPVDVFESPIAFTRFAAVLEEIGIGAYLGAIGNIRDGELRKAAASIYGVESRHAALMRLLGGEQFSPRYYEGALTMAQVNSLVAPYGGAMSMPTPPTVETPPAPAATPTPAPPLETTPAPAPATPPAAATTETPAAAAE